MQDLVEIQLSLWLQILRQPCPSRYVQNLREFVGHLVPRATGGGVAGRCEREGRLRANLAEDTIRRRDCKISSRSSYHYGCRFCANPVRADTCKTFENLWDTWFHVRLGAGLRDVVKERGGCAQTSQRTQLEGGIASSRRDLTLRGVKCWASL